MKHIKLAALSILALLLTACGSKPKEQSNLPFYGLELDMSPAQVHKLLGDPDESHDSAVDISEEYKSLTLFNDDPSASYVKLIYVDDKLCSIETFEDIDTMSTSFNSNIDKAMAAITEIYGEPEIEEFLGKLYKWKDNGIRTEIYISSDSYIIGTSQL